MPRTKIIATLGPATRTEERVAELLHAGVDVFRLNFSHGSHEEHGHAIELVRKISEKIDKPVAVLQDLQGPRIRTGRLRGGSPVKLDRGKHLILASAPTEGSSEKVSIDYPQLPERVKTGDRILLDDGRIQLRVLEVRGSDIATQVVSGGPLGENKGVNLPGIAVDMPSLTEKDKRDLEFGLAHDVDFVALSFVRKARDVVTLKEFIRKANAKTPVIAKLERPEALPSLDEILSVSDGVMVARGDLGVELSLEQVPLAQKTIISKASEYGVVSITATQMLESMRFSPQPTRAEVSDVANAILDGTDAIMLSGETSIGEYPVEAVQMAARIAGEVEKTATWQRHNEPKQLTPSHAVAHAAAEIARDLKAKAIVVLTHSGYTARMISKARPYVPVYAFTNDLAVKRRLALYWGIEPFYCQFGDNTDATLAIIEDLLVKQCLAKERDLIVFVGSAPVGAGGRTNYVRVKQIEVKT